MKMGKRGERKKVLIEARFIVNVSFDIRPEMRRDCSTNGQRCRCVTRATAEMTAFFEWAEIGVASNRGIIVSLTA